MFISLGYTDDDDDDDAEGCRCGHPVLRLTVDRIISISIISDNI